MTRTTRTLAVLLLALAGSACSDDAVEPRAGAASASATAPRARPTTPATTPATSPATSLATSGAPAPGAPTSPGAPAERPALPPAAAQVDQGDRVWAVYLGLSRLAADGAPEDPGSLTQSKAQAEAAGYTDRVVGGDVDCDRGAREALELDAERAYVVTSLFFDTEAQARQFVAAYEPPVVGLAEITAFCLD